MSAARLIRVDATPPQRWRNGGGWTRELLVWPTAADWRVRVSVADIEADGPFSSFPGVRRFFAVLEGAGVELTIDGELHHVRGADAALQFAGDATTNCCLLQGPTRDLNLMVRGKGGAMESVVAKRQWTPPSGVCGLFALTTGTCRSGDVSMTVPGLSLLWFERAPASLGFDSAGWWLAA